MATSFIATFITKKYPYRRSKRILPTRRDVLHFDLYMALRGMQFIKVYVFEIILRLSALRPVLKKNNSYMTGSILHLNK